MAQDDDRPTVARSLGERISVAVPEVPVAMFGSVMGVAGLGHAWRKAATVLGTPAWVGEVLIFIAVLLFALIAAAYGLKTARSPERVRAEFSDLQQFSLFATISLSLLLLAGGALPLQREIAGGLWISGAVLQFVLALTVLARWFRGPYPREAFDPSLFLPLAGLALGPVVGVPLGFVEASWLMFAAGLVLWVLVLTLLIDQLFFRAALAPARLPTLAISMTPPALAFMSYIQFNEGVQFSEGAALGGFGRVLFYAAFLFFLLNLTQFDRFVRAPFSVTWWAFTFPLAAVTGAAMDYHAAPGTQFPAIICALLLAFATLVTTYIALRTISGLIAGNLLPQLSIKDGQR